MITIKKIHMVGIGGAGMSPLAEALLSRGHSITGSDRIPSVSTHHLEELGVKIQYTHEPFFVRDADLLVYSSAVKEDNPERVYAAENGIPELRRAEVLGDLMKSNFTICISGTHGKTTTTSLVGTVLTDANVSPTVLVGGMFKNSGSHAIIGRGGVIVAEADEYDRSFLAMYPSIVVITNIEADHLDCYKDIDDIKDTFIQFTERVPFDGAVIACIDDNGVKDVLPKIRRTVVTYGVDSKADYMASAVRFEKGVTVFDVSYKGKNLGSVKISLPGMHNVKNVLAALVVACETGIEFTEAAQSVSRFQGVKRRFEIIGSVNGITIVDDYAHHPGEISATLDAARKCGYKRICAVFQPHLYSRTRDFLNQFAETLSGADLVIVTDIYKSREQPIPGINAKSIVDIINNNGESTALYVHDKKDIAGSLSEKLTEGDLVIFMGAGDIWETAHDFAKGNRANG
ncbi:MAG: UDP-N-acetylmuramate--L-alanine ligase [Chitinispirillales bacterium]|nr:UDP-N-acetylmuramate--L-alanine ligase [Chitinispirillales bacterium]